MRASIALTVGVLVLAPAAALGAEPSEPAEPAASAPAGAATPPTPPPADAAAPASPEAAQGAPAEEPAEKVSPETFDEAVAIHYAAKPRDAAPLFFTYVNGSSRTAESFEWAEYFLAEDLAQLGFSHAAVVYLADVAKTRSRAEVLPVALRSLERISQSGPYDSELVDREVLAATDFGFIPPEAAGYVRFQKGLCDYKNGQLRWAWGHFDQLEPGTEYHARARLVRAVHELERENDADGALSDLLALAEDQSAPRKVRNEARISVARLYFERGDFEKANAFYDSVEMPELDPGRGQIYLEKAWAHYRRGEDSKAMGLLLALEAPSFRELFLPEKYLLASLIYKDRCHYLPAKRAARGFTRRYGSALKLIRERGSLESDERLLAAALELDLDARAAGDLVALLQREQELIDAFASRFEESGLTRALHQLYERALAEAIRQRAIALERALPEAADRLLREEEQVRLLDYEIGLELYKRVKKGSLSEASTQVDEAPGEGDVVFPFDGEHWNDELMDYRLRLPSRCAAAEADR